MAARTRAFTVMTVTLFAVALAGCTDTTPPTDVGTTASQTPSGTPAEAPGDLPSGEPSEAPSDEPTADVGYDDPGTVSETTQSADAFLTVHDIRAGAHDGFDRVVFDLGGTGTPGWRVEYVGQALDDGSGLPVDVAGDAVLQVRISGVGLPTDTGIDEFIGDAVDLHGDGIEQVVYRFTFEGYATAFVGTAGRAPFRVFTLSDPTRLVIDVRHAEG